jgi:3-oxoacyl-[acyl-carrier protein] reductase
VDLGLKGLRAIVTGGTRGIGRAIVETLLAERAQVAFCARNPEEVAAAEAAFKVTGAKSFGTAADISDSDALKAWVIQAAKAMGGIDIVVANVSALAVGNDEASWRKGYEVDLMGTVRLVEAAMPELTRSANASIVTIASVSGREVDFAAGPYGKRCRLSSESSSKFCYGHQSGCRRGIDARRSTLNPA